MSVASVSSSLTNFVPTPQNSPSKFQQFKQDFQQLGKDIASGNLSGAQALFANIPKPGEGQSSSQPGVAIEQEFGALGQALASGNLAASQQNFTQIQQRVENRFDQGQ